jgi:PAS domain S-box-containing protein
MKVEQATESLNPVLNVSKDGTIIYSNEASEPILDEWGVKVGEKLPSSIGDLVQNAFSRNNSEKIEVKVGNKLYLIVFSPLPKYKCVSISGFDISDQKKAEEKTKESEERLMALMDHNPSLLFMKDNCGRYVYLNNAYEKQFVHSKYWYGKTDFDFWPKESAELFRANDSLVLKSGQTHQLMEDSTDLNGTRYCWLNYKFPFTDSKNERFVGGIAIDVTDRVRAEEALKKSEERLKLAIRASHVMVYDLDVRSLRVTNIQGLYDLLGYEVAETEMMFGWWYSHIFPEDIEICHSAFERIQTLPHDQILQYRVRHKDGRCLWVEDHATPVYDEFRQVMRIVGTVKDITKRKLVETEQHESELKYRNLLNTLEEKVKERTIKLKHAFESLRKSEKSLAEAQEMAHIGNWEWDIFNDKAYWSEEMYRIFKRDPQKLAPSLKEYLSYIHPDDLDYYCDVTTHTINTGKVDFPEVDLRIVLENGEKRTLHQKSEYIFNDGNTPIRVKGIVQDITDRKNMEDTLEKMRIARKKEIHHRIKNNLQVISSLLDLQAEKFRGKSNIKDSEVLEAFKVSEDRVISMALIHEELYKDGHIETLNVSHYIEDLTDNLILTYRVGNNGIILDTDIEEDVFFDMDTSVPLGIIINELVSNSFKYAFIGRNHGEIRIKLHRKKNDECETEGCSISYILNVSDSGIGIPEDLKIEDLDSLGLQLVTTLVEQLDGELELKRDHGTEFIIRFSVQENNNLPSKTFSPKLVDND